MQACNSQPSSKAKKSETELLERLFSVKVYRQQPKVQWKLVTIPFASPLFVLEPMHYQCLCKSSIDINRWRVSCNKMSTLIVHTLQYYQVIAGLHSLKKKERKKEIFTSLFTYLFVQDCTKSFYELIKLRSWPTEVSSDSACAPFLRQRFEKKMAMEDDPTNGSREKKDRRRTPSLVDILSCSSKKNYPRGFGSQYLLYKICSLDANGQLECLLTSRSSKRDGRSPTNSMTN